MEWVFSIVDTVLGRLCIILTAIRNGRWCNLLTAQKGLKTNCRHLHVVTSAVDTAAGVILQHPGRFLWSKPCPIIDGRLDIICHSFWTNCVATSNIHKMIPEAVKLCSRLCCARVCVRKCHIILQGSRGFLEEP